MPFFTDALIREYAGIKYFPENFRFRKQKLHTNEKLQIYHDFVDYSSSNLQYGRSAVQFVHQSL